MRNRITALKSAAETARKSDAYRAEGASLHFTEALVARMKDCGMTRSVLAEKISTSPAYVTKILRGDTNFTLDTMSKIAAALGCELSIGLHPEVNTNRQPTVSYRNAITISSPLLNDGERKTV